MPRSKDSIDTTEVVPFETADLFDIFYIKSYLPEIAELLGTEAAVRLISVFGGLELNLPSKKHFLLTCRNLCILKSYSKGVSSSILAKQFRLSPQRVTQLYRETRATILAYNRLKEQGFCRVKLSNVNLVNLLCKDNVQQAILTGDIDNCAELKQFVQESTADE